MALTSHWGFVDQSHNHFLLPQDSNAPTMHLNTPHFKNTTPMDAYMGISAVTN